MSDLQALPPELRQVCEQIVGLYPPGRVARITLLPPKGIAVELNGGRREP